VERHVVIQIPEPHDRAVVLLTSAPDAQHSPPHLPPLLPTVEDSALLSWIEQVEIFEEVVHLELPYLELF